MSECEFAEAPAERRRSIFYDSGHGSDGTMDNSCQASGMLNLMTLEPQSKEPSTYEFSQLLISQGGLTYVL